MLPLKGGPSGFPDRTSAATSQFPESSKVVIMPGSKPGERRGGRQKGTPNDTLTPARLQLIAMREAAKAGFVASALAIARDVVPYYDAKLAPLIVEPPKSRKMTARVGCMQLCVRRERRLAMSHRVDGQ
jgi:hypothetical protein